MKVAIASRFLMRWLRYEIVKLGEQHLRDNKIEIETRLREIQTAKTQSLEIRGAGRTKYRKVGLQTQ